MKTIKFLLFCVLSISFSYAQNKETKTDQTLKVNKDVTINLNTSYAEIELDTWNKNEIKIEAYIVSDALSKEELKTLANEWQLNVESSADEVEISSKGVNGFYNSVTRGYSYYLKDLEFDLANIPELPEISEVIILPPMENFPELPEMPEMPKMPKLPKLPKGVTTISFDYDKYQKEGDTYLKEWSKRYEKKGGKELQKRMEKWAKEFAESDYGTKIKSWSKAYGNKVGEKWAKEAEEWIEKFAEGYEGWGEQFEEKFNEDWANRMQEWGERFAEEMERRTELLQKRNEQKMKIVEKRAEMQMKRAEERAKRKQELEKRKRNLIERKIKVNGFKNSNYRKVIKIKIPKNAKLKTNIRHGELKISSAIYNLKADLSHTALTATHIDGTNTSINVAYAPVVIDNWDVGDLSLKFVENAIVKKSNQLVLNANSSNVILKEIKQTGIIDGSFGDLIIEQLSPEFQNLNLVLENSDAQITLPKQIGYNVFFTGHKSRLNSEVVKQKTLRIPSENKENTNKNVVINAKLSHVVLN